MIMKKIFFVYPPSVIMNREGRCQQPTKDLMLIPPLPPIELLYYASIAKKSGYDCKVKDYSVKAETLKDFEKDFREYKPDYLLINAASPTLENDLAVCSIAKKIDPQIVTIACGTHFLAYAKEVMDKNPQIDFIIRGEGEYTLEELLLQKPLSEIKGLVYRLDEDVIINEDRPFIDNLDELPFPARDLVDNKIFKRPDNGKIQTIIKVSRGCPYHCFFCLATPVSGSKVRMRTPKNIVDEIKECIKKYNIRNFVFWSDIFDIDHNWVKDLCNKIIDEKLDIVWSANTRADTITEELAKLMHKSGCNLVSLGIESGSQEILDKIGKNITLEQAENAVKVLKKAGIKTYNYFVIGLPWETKEHIEKTIEFAKKLDSDFASFYTAAVLPPSKLYYYVKENNLEQENESFYTNTYYYPGVKTHYLSKAEILKLHKKAMKEYYLRPIFIIKKIFSVQSFTEIKNYFKSGMALLLKK